MKTAFLLSCFLFSFVLCAETPEESAVKFITAWYHGDFAVIKANCNPRHPFLKPDFDQKEDLAGLAAVQKEIGAFREVVSASAGPWRNGRCKVALRLRFEKGDYEGAIHLIEGNRFSGVYAPWFDSAIRLPELNREQMLADYDYMVEVLRDMMPHAPAIKEGYGIDVWAKLAGYRTQIVEGMTLPEFAGLVEQALYSCKGHHLGPVTPRKELMDYIRQIYGDEISPETVGINAAVRQLAGMRYRPEKCSAQIPLAYWDGYYYTLCPFLWRGKRYPARMLLETLDGRSPKELEAMYRDRLFRFDRKNRLAYADDFQTMIPAAAPDGGRTFVFTAPTGERVEMKTAAYDPVETEFDGSSFFSIRKQVISFPGRRMVYLRVPSMNSEVLPFFREELAKVLAEDKPEAAVIDIRGNGGGSDLVPEKLLQQLSARPVRYEASLALPANPRARAYMERRGPICKNPPVTRVVPFLDNREFDVTGIHSSLQPEPDGTVKRIYVIAHNIYSAAGTLVAIAAQNDFITSLGFASPFPLGMGVEPYWFVLPNSRMILSVEPAIDISGCRNAADCLHSDVEVELPMTAEEYLRYLSEPVPKDCRDYLEHRDPFMKRIFELETGVH